MSQELPTSLLISIASRHVETRILDAVRAAGLDSLTPAQARLLAGIEEGGSRISTLADRAQITRQTATVLVDRLEEAGYVARIPDPSDGRARLVVFTDVVRDRLPVARAEEQRIEAEWRAHLGDERFAQFRTALEDLRAIVDRPRP